MPSAVLIYVIHSEKVNLSCIPRKISGVLKEKTWQHHTDFLHSEAFAWWVGIDVTYGEILKQKNPAYLELSRKLKSSIKRKEN